MKKILEWIEKNGEELSQVANCKNITKDEAVLYILKKGLEDSIREECEMMSSDDGFRG